MTATGLRADEETPHAWRIEFLITLAQLLGCTNAVGSILPDGTRPDVLRIDPVGEMLFIGDAKDTEKPGCAATQCRLFRYLRWIASHRLRQRGLSVFALCFGRRDDQAGWLSTVTMLASEAGLPDIAPQVRKFGRDTIVVWLVYENSRDTRPKQIYS